MMRKVADRGRRAVSGSERSDAEQRVGRSNCARDRSVQLVRPDDERNDTHAEKVSDHVPRGDDEAMANDTHGVKVNDAYEVKVNDAYEVKVNDAHVAHEVTPNVWHIDSHFPLLLAAHWRQSPVRDTACPSVDPAVGAPHRRWPRGEPKVALISPPLQASTLTTTCLS